MAINACISNLTDLRDGNELYSTNIKKYTEDVVVVDERHEYNGHVLTTSATKQEGIKQKFLDCLLININRR
ncbi:hypothetical protein DPMN_052583 [Dreissena polymorpha]|uniref:Uncharacterized protein n=1 Tax=Dreissena polymorpha TaxID=45954 RepID=A0A9D4HPG6_DREPO|nr:hypothetical protein DPMN_052583 [Dreissena polymorpha]